MQDWLTTRGEGFDIPYAPHHRPIRMIQLSLTNQNTTATVTPHKWHMSCELKLFRAYAWKQTTPCYWQRHTQWIQLFAHTHTQHGLHFLLLQCGLFSRPTTSSHLQTPAITCSHLQTPSITYGHLQTPTNTKNYQQSLEVTKKHQQSPAVTNSYLQSPAVTYNHQQSPTVTY